MDDGQDKSMRRLGRWIGKIRGEFLGGLRGERVASRRTDEIHERETDDASGRTVTLRSTTIEEVRVHEPGGGSR